MFTLEFLQNYWWFVISLLGGCLVFLLFVQGGQTLFAFNRDKTEKELMVNSIGHKWELTFTTLVVFGGAFFASFPLFYSTSFGGAYWLWMLILFSFIVQAVSYEYRSKPGNLYGTATYDTLLFINGCVGCVLLGVAVAMFFFGAEFTVSRGNLLDNSSPVISRWASTHGFEAIASWRNLLLGFTVLFLARTLGAMYLLATVSAGPGFTARYKRSVLINGVIFTVLFLGFVAVLLTADGIDATGQAVPCKYLGNLFGSWWILVTFLCGVLLVLAGIGLGAFTATGDKGIWAAGAGTVLAVMALFWIAGYNGTAYYPSLTDPASSLTIANSSSSRFTLEVMTWVTLLVPVVLWYISTVWRTMTRHSIDEKELRSPDNEKY